MPNIKPISDLRNYGEVFRGVSAGSPVFLTKNGRGRYAVIHIDEYVEYEKTMAWRMLESEILKIVAIGKSGIYPPRGRCREFICQINDSNIDAEVMVAPDRVVKLLDLLPTHRRALKNLTKGL